ncbi:MAG: hypothetical protein ACHQ52_11260 [Candidatus Eisenbacteria bacterium]
MFRRSLIALVLAAILAPVVHAETVDEIVAKNIQARGGLDKLKGVSTMKVSGKLVMAGGAMEIPFTRVSKRPDGMRMDFTFQGISGTQAFDGKTAWQIMPFQTGKKDPEQSNAEQTKLIEEQADFDGPLVDWKTKGHQLELVDTESVDGADAWKLKLTRKNGNVDYMYIDKETGLEVKTESKRTINGTEVESEAKMSDYKEVDGLTIPFTVSSGMKGGTDQQQQKVVMDKVELNVTVSDSSFVMPPVAATPDSAAAKAPEKTAEKTADTAKPAAKTGKKK